MQNNKIVLSRAVCAANSHARQSDRILCTSLKSSASVSAVWNWKQCKTALTDLLWQQNNNWNSLLIDFFILKAIQHFLTAKSCFSLKTVMYTTSTSELLLRQKQTLLVLMYETPTRSISKNSPAVWKKKHSQDVLPVRYYVQTNLKPAEPTGHVSSHGFYHPMAKFYGQQHIRKIPYHTSRVRQLGAIKCIVL